VPALAAVPVEPGRGVERQHGRGLRHREAPEVLPGIACDEPGQREVARGVPVGCGLVRVLALAAEPCAGRVDGGGRAAQAQPQAATALAAFTTAFTAPSSRACAPAA